MSSGGLQLLHWHWWVIGLLLMTVEAFLPGAFFLWMGLAALVVGLVLWVIPGLGLLTQVGLFAVLAIGSAALWRKLRPRGAGREQTERAPLNDRGRLYVGRLFTLDDPIIDGVGHLRVDDGQWRVTGPDLPAGRRVRVKSVDGTTMHVEPAD
jgi:membrane protein implicated in regulation of membrane protease activity